MNFKPRAQRNASFCYSVNISESAVSPAFKSASEPVYNMKHFNNGLNIKSISLTYS